jgi:hypothetical protein
MEGMAEYLSIGPSHPLTAGWLRDAAVAGNIPTIKQMTDRPDKYFPYRFGESFWQYVGERWGDAAIGEILRNTPAVGVERAFFRELGMPLTDVGSAWREAVQSQYLPAASSYSRPQTFAAPLLTHKKSGGEIFLAPTLSNDGKYIAFLSNGNQKRGELFIDLWLGDGRTGQRVKRLVKSTLNPDFEELRLLYSQSAFSNDEKTLAFTAMREGKDVLYLLDIPSRQVRKRLDLPLDGVMSPSYSPDDKRIVFSGTAGGVTDLYIIDSDGKNLRKLTNDLYGDLQPVWSPDGKRIAFATDRNAPTDITRLRFAIDRCGDRSDRTCPESGRPQSQPDVGAGWSVDCVHLRSHRCCERLPLRSEGHTAVPAHQRDRRRIRNHRIQPGAYVGARRRPNGVHVLRERRLHGVVDGQPALAEENGVHWSGRGIHCSCDERSCDPHAYDNDHRRTR